MRDGCATFFKRSSFECKAVVPVEYFVPGVASLDRDNVAVLLLLQPKHNSQSTQTQAAKLCIANTHLLFNPRRGDVKLAQLMKLLAEVDRLTYKPCPADTHRHSHYPVLMCGDMNLEPFSDLYKFLRGEKLALNGQPAAKLSGQERKWSRYDMRPMTGRFLGKHAKLTDQSQYVSVCQQRFLKLRSQVTDTVKDDMHCETSQANDNVKDDIPETSQVGDTVKDYTHCETSQANDNVKGDTHCETTSSSETEPSVPCTSTSQSCEEEIFTQGSGIVSHKFCLNSVYEHVLTNGDDRKSAREVTTCHSLANCTVDYIFYTSPTSDENHSENDFLQNSASPITHTASHDETPADKHQYKISAYSDAPLSASSDQSLSHVLQQGNVSSAAHEITDYRLTLLARLQLLSDKEMKDVGDLPNKFISSDHLILAAQFLLSNG